MTTNRNEPLPYAEIMKLAAEWSKDKGHLRFGQMMLNKYFPSLAMPELYYETNLGKALHILTSQPRFCSDAYDVQAELKEVVGQHFTDKINKGDDS